MHFNNNLCYVLIASHSNSQMLQGENLMWLQSAFNSTNLVHSCYPLSGHVPFFVGSFLHQFGIEYLLPDNCNTGSICKLMGGRGITLEHSHRHTVVARRDNQGRTPHPYNFSGLICCNNHSLADAIYRICAK
jgi:hypothetical protein